MIIETTSGTVYKTISINVGTAQIGFRDSVSMKWIILKTGEVKTIKDDIASHFDVSLEPSQLN